MVKKENGTRPLHLLQIDKLSRAINRAHTLLHSFLLSFFLYHRISLLFHNDAVLSPLLLCLLLFLIEIPLSLFWVAQQAFRWRPVDRAVFVDRLPEDSRLPAIDVLVCTADPDKEPTLEVMNTVISAMALDYPMDKLHVYLSDDGGSPVTLSALKDAWEFATWWVPFCRKYEVKCRCPMAYFGEKPWKQSAADAPTFKTCDDFAANRLRVKEKYELFKEGVEKLLEAGSPSKNRGNHPPLVQVINEQCTDPSRISSNHADIPLLVYVAREKRPSYPHHFKAGALNSLLKVSGLMSNSPIVLALDCDMYCNDPTTAKQAMCFYLDPEISPSLAFVQFPQRFRNLSKHDIYDTGLRMVFQILMPGMDGTNVGPMVCGSGFYMNRKAVYNTKGVGLDLVELRKNFGTSNEFLKTLNQDINTHVDVSSKVLQEAEFLASCTYEKDTQWGKEVGFLYHSVVEDVFTGYNLHCRGWKSVFLNPKRDPFLGTTTTNLNDLLTQNSRWYAGCLEIGLSRFCPLVHDLPKRRLPLLQSIIYTYCFLHPLMFVSSWCLAIIPQLCLLHGIPLYPKVSSSLFPVLATIFISSLLKHLQEVLQTGGTIMSWWNEERMWILKMLTCSTYGTLDVILKILGLKETSFIPTNKVIDDEQANWYNQGIYDFRTSNMFLVPLVTAVILNLVCFVGGLMRIMVVKNWEEMAAQVFLSGFYLVLSLPVIEGMFVRKDRGRVRTSATLISIAICLVVMVLGPFILFHN